MLEQYWFWVFIATITAERWGIFLTDIHILNISFAVEKTNTYKITLLNLQKSIYKIQKECFYRVNHVETTIPFLWKWNQFMWLWNKKLLVRRVELGYIHVGEKNGTWQKWQEIKRGKVLIQNTPLSNQTCNTCGGKYISSRTQGLFAWENLIVKEHKHTCCTGIRTSQSKTMAC